jgi:hypothetical protein
LILLLGQGYKADAICANFGAVDPISRQNRTARPLDQTRLKEEPSLIGGLIKNVLAFSADARHHIKSEAASYTEVNDEAILSRDSSRRYLPENSPPR